MSQKIKPGHVLVEVVHGIEGPSLSIGDNDTGERVAGPKPWGGGRTVNCFQVAAKDLIRLAKEYASAEPGAPVDEIQPGVCKGENCTSTGKTPHSSECRFEHARALASGIKNVTLIEGELDERAAFESWCAVIGYALKPSEHGNGFKPGYGSELFSAWKARAALERKP